MSASAVDGWETRHVRHRSSHRPRETRTGPGTRLASAPAEWPTSVDEDRTWRQRASDTLPMAMVAGVCFALGLSLRAGGASGPAPAFPIWTLFLALGCIAMLGAGASWVVGGSSAAATVDVRPARASDHLSTSSPVPRASSPSWIGDEEDDQLPALDWEPQETIMPKKAAHRSSMAPPPQDPLADLAEPGDVADATGPQVIEEIDRLLMDLKPAQARGRPSA